MEPLAQKLRTVAAAARDGHTFAVAMVLDGVDTDDQPHAAIYKVEGTQAQRIGKHAHNVPSLTWLSANEVMTLGEWGEVDVVTLDGDRAKEAIAADRGPLRYVQVVDGRAFASGTALQVFERGSDGVWTDVSPSEEQREAYPDSSLEMLDGFSAKDIYAAGAAGVLWRYDGTIWTAIQTPVEGDLYAVTCAADGYVWATGADGKVIRGRNEAFVVVATMASVDGFRGIARERDTTYVSGVTGLYEVRQGSITPCASSLTAGDAFDTLQWVEDSGLWCFGTKNAIRFDGAQWSRVGQLEVS